MLPINDALAHILEQATAITNIEHLPVAEAVGRVLAEDQGSDIDVPPADNSAMDGYAIHTDALSDTGATQFEISQTITAGDIATTLTEKTAARIFTGAEIPHGANAVVMQEDCEADNGTVMIPSNIAAQQNIRKQGQDIKKGQCLLNKGSLLRPQDCGLLASVGLASVPVYRRLRVAILSTGNELVEPGQALEKGKIYNSNRYLLKALLTQLGWDILDCGLARDNLDETKACLQKAAAADCIISTGGVSVGEEDYIKQAVTEMGQLNLWRIAIKPGKPLAFGRIDATPFFGLPGNPVSTFVTFLLFVKPFLSIKQGLNYKAPASIYYQADFNNKANPKRQEYLRVTIHHDKENPRVTAFTNQSSGVLSSVATSDGLAVIPINTTVEPGDKVEVIPYSHFFH